MKIFKSMQWYFKKSCKTYQSICVISCIT